MNYSLCILAAGCGERMLPLTKNINKALLPINGKAVISHIIEKHYNANEIVIAVHYEKEKIKEYLDCAYAGRKIIFVDVPKIKGLGSGPGFSLICCREYLNKPFVLSTVDTLYEGNCPNPSQNWMGISKTNNPSTFCTVNINVKKKVITSIIDKKNYGTDNAFIGIAGINDYKLFFDNLINDNTSINGEIQVSNGFKGLIKKKLKFENFKWFDTGSLDGYIIAEKKFSKGIETFDFSKKDEYIYFVNDKVIKYFADPNIIANRLKRTKKLKNLVPTIKFNSKYFYSYSIIKGNVLYEKENQFSVSDLLKWLKDELWIKKPLTLIQRNNFFKACHDFYYKKTLNRLKDFYLRFDFTDQESFINNIKIPKVKEILDFIDFDWLSEGVATNFHGDLQFDNILITSDKKFKLLDWRQDFSGLIDYGDMYYDLAKLNGGLYISYKKIKQNEFYFKLKNNNAILEMEENKFLEDAKKIFNEFVQKNNLDLKKIEILTGIIFLNMSPMHNAPFSHYVYYLGKKQLYYWISK